VNLTYSKLIRKQTEERGRAIRTSRKHKTIGRTIGTESLQKEINYYRWWFLYLKLALELDAEGHTFTEYQQVKTKKRSKVDPQKFSVHKRPLRHKVKVDRMSYGEWDLDEVLTDKFDKWWKTHKHLFIEHETVQIESFEEIEKWRDFGGNTSLYRIDTRKPTNDIINELRQLLPKQSRTGNKTQEGYDITGYMQDEILFNVYNYMVMNLKGWNATKILEKEQYFKQVRNGQIGLSLDDRGNVDYQRNSERTRELRNKGHRLILTVADGYFIKHGKNKQFFARK